MDGWYGRRLRQMIGAGASGMAGRGHRARSGRRSVGLLVLIVMLSSATAWAPMRRVADERAAPPAAETIPASLMRAVATTLNESAKLLASDGFDLDDFGISVSLDGDRALIGARFDDDNGV